MMDEEIKVVDLYIENLRGYLKTIIYKQSDGAYEAVTHLNQKDPSSTTITLDIAGDIENLLLRHQSAVNIEVAIQISKGNLKPKNS